MTGDDDGGTADGDGDLDAASAAAGASAGADLDGDAEVDVDADAATGADGGVPDPGVVLERVGFDPDASVLTRRQAEVFTLRERGVRQSRIADLLGTSRANVASVESSARTNVAKARETVAFVEALSAPVRVSIPVGTDLYDVPNVVYDACDEAGVKVTRTAPDLMKLVSDEAGDAVRGREVAAPVLVGVTGDGEVRVRRSTGSDSGSGSGAVTDGDDR